MAAILMIAVVGLLATTVFRNPGYAQDEPRKAEATEAMEIDAVTTATGRPWERGPELKGVTEFSQKNRMGFLATVDQGKPRVRAFGLMKIAGDTLYFGTSNKKDVYKQLMEVPYAEWIAMDPQTYTTLRVFGEVVFVDDLEMKRQIIAGNPMIRDLYSGERERDFELFYMRKTEANWFAIPAQPKAAPENAGE
jgi:uncharacterized pyridoxamine 5'-phosphate oxidase family protein